MKRFISLIIIIYVFTLFNGCEESMEEYDINSTTQAGIEATKNREQEVIERISLIPTVMDIDVVPTDDTHDRMNGCGILLYFSSSLVDQSQFDEEAVAEKGTACGGSVEIYSTDADALARDEYLAGGFIDMMSPGTHAVRGNIVVRISKKMTDTQQREFEDIVYTVLNAEAESELSDIASFVFSTDSENQHEASEVQEDVNAIASDEVLMPESDYYYEGENYNTVIKQFQDMGFDNVMTVEVKDITNDLFVEDGDVKEITIDGIIGFEKKQIFKKTAEVVITYRTYTDDARSKMEDKERLEANKNNEESITLENNSDFKDLLSHSSISEEDWKSFVQQHEGRILEFDAVMNYETSFEEGDINVSAIFYAVYNNRVVYDPFFWIIDVNTYRNGFEEFDFSDTVNIDQQPVHVNLRIKRYDEDFGYCIIVEEIDIKKR